MTSTNSAGKALIINYHYCAPENQADYPGLRGIRPDIFSRHLNRLAHLYDPWESCMLPIQPQEGGRPRFLITFDDGSRNVFEHAIPVVRRHNAPSVIFCCSQPYIDHRVLNVQKTHLLQGKWGWVGFRTKFMAALDSVKEHWTADDPSSLGLGRMYRYDDEETARFKRLLNAEIPYPIVDKVLDMLFEAEFGPQAEMVKYLYMSPDEIKQCRDWGIIIGLHGHSHCMFSRLSPHMQAREIDVSIAYFRDALGLDIEILSYPYGIRGSWNHKTKSLAANRGLRAGYTLGREIYDPGIHTDPFEIPRYDVNDVFDSGGELNHDFKTLCSTT